MIRRNYTVYIICFLLNFYNNTSLHANVSDTSICKGASIKLTSPIQKASKYWWNTGDSVQTISVKPNTSALFISFAVIAKDTSRDSIKVNVLEYPNKPQIDFKDSSIIVSNPLKLSIRWLRNNIELNASKDSLKYPTEGVYRVKMGVREVCWTYSDPLYLVKDYDTTKQSFDFITYPNPSTGSFNLYITAGKRISQEIKVKIVDASGKDLFSKSYFMYQSDNIKIPVALPLGIKEQLVISCFVQNKWITKQHVVN